MKRKTSGRPTRVYTYGCLAPIEGGDLVGDQLFLASRYYNKLIEIERWRRTEYRQIEATITGPLADEVNALKAKREQLRADREVLRQTIKDKRKGAGKIACPEESAQIASIQVELKVVGALFKEKRAEFRATNKELQERNLKLQAEVQRKQKDLYGAEKALAWGTKLKVKEAADAACRRKGADPRFKRFDGSGRIVVQIQKSAPLSGAGLFADDTRVRIAPVPPETWTGNRGQRRKLSRTTVKIRVGSEEKSKAPVWATFPVVLHRPIPADADVKWAWIQVSRVGTRLRYQLQLALEIDLETIHAEPDSAVALDIGWREQADGMRVGFVVGSDPDGCAAPIVVPRRILDRLKHVEDLRSIRDKHFDAVREILKGWVATNKVPEWLAEDLRFLANWRATAKLSRVAWKWKQRRFEGDDVIFAAVEAWRRKDRHLYQWESNEREGAYAARSDFFRNVAAQLTRRYAAIVVESFDLRSMTAAPEVEKEGPGSKFRYNLRAAAPNSLRLALKSAAARRGAAVHEVGAAFTSRTCHRCGHNGKWANPTEVEHTCDGCGAVWDRDLNAAHNILARWRASGGVMAKTPSPLASEKSPAITGG